MREFEVSLNFFLFPVNPTFFMRLPVGSVVFVSHRLQRVVFRAGKVSVKNTSQGKEDFLNEPKA